ncbi:MAG: hypothetical protein JWM59_3000 [Verrucomicrobiales bacterium]|nr:hypothetical protein [Verrucomicrobiales bacterium]
MALWAVALTVATPFTHLYYILKTEGGGPLMAAVLATIVMFRLPFLGVVAWRLKVTPHPVPETDPDSGPLFRRWTITLLQIMGMLYHLIWFFDALRAAVWPLMVVSVWWMIWFYGMMVRERARCSQLAKG